MKFLLDANFLMIPGKFRVDIFSELMKFGKPELYTLGLVVEELEKIATSRGSDARHAKLGLKLIEKKGVKVLKTQGKNADEEILKFSKKGFMVCTQDRALRKRLKLKGIKAVSLRQKKYLFLE